MIDEIDILQYCKSRDFSRNAGKEAHWLFCIITYHHELIIELGEKSFDSFSGQRRSSVAGLTEDDRQTVDKERQVGDPMQLRTEVLNL